MDGFSPLWAVLRCGTRPGNRNFYSPSVSAPCGTAYYSRHLPFFFLIASSFMFRILEIGVALVIVICSSPALIRSIFGVTMGRESLNARLLLAYLPSVVVVVRVGGRHAWCLSLLFFFLKNPPYGALEQ